MMRKLIVFGLMMMIALGLSGVARAQAQGQRTHSTTAQDMAELKARLNLTPDQVTKVHDIVKKYHQHAKIKKPTQVERRQMHQQIMVLLNRDQKIRYKQYIEEIKQRHASQNK